MGKEEQYVTGSKEAYQEFGPWDSPWVLQKWFDQKLEH